MGEKQKLTSLFLPMPPACWSLTRGQRCGAEHGRNRDRQKISSTELRPLHLRPGLPERVQEPGLPASVPGKAEPSHAIPVHWDQSLFPPNHPVRIWGKKAARGISKPKSQLALQSPLCNKGQERRWEDKGAGQQEAG